MNKRAIPYLGLGFVLLLITAIVGAGLMVGAVYIVRPALAAQLDFAPNPEKGLIIVAVDPSGPTANTSIVRGDILLQVDGQEVDGRFNLSEMLRAYEPGKKVKLTVLHGDEVREVLVTLSERSGAPAIGLAVCCGLDDAQGLNRFQFGPGEFSFEMPQGRYGALVLEVVSGSAAEGAGLQPGDLIVSVEGVEIGKDGDLADLIGSYAAGETIKLEVHRPGEESQEIPVTLGNHPEREGDPYLGVKYQPISNFGNMGEGLPLDELPFEFLPGERMPDGHPPINPDGDFFFPEGAIFQGVIIRQVIENTPAEAAGLQAGEIILEIDGEEVADPTALVKILKNFAPGDVVSLTVQSIEGDSTRDLEIVLGEHPENEAMGYLGIVPGGGLQFHRGPEGENFDFENFLPRFFEGLPDGDFEFQFDFPEFDQQDT